MNEIKPKKERRFLKTLGRVGEILVEQVLLKLGSSIIRKIGGKKNLPSILFLFLSLNLFAQFPNTGNKQRLGFQTTADGLVWRGALSDTASIQPINNQSAWVILDTINLKFYTFDFTSNVWNLVGGGGAAFTQPVDSLFFNTGVPTNNVDTAKMRWDSDLATVVLGLNDNVPNELGFKNFWLVKNQTGSTITKGSIVYANGTVGSSGRITVAKFIANGSIDAKYLLGITAHDLSNGEDGYVISFGKIRQVNTDTFAAGAILYPSPTVAGVWTDVEPIAPNIDMPIGFCINSSSNNGTIAIRVASGYKLSELHDVSITSPVEKSSLYYSGGLWRDTTAALLVSDTASMLLPYLRDADTVTLSNRINLKLNIADTSAFARDNQISGTSGQVAYFNSSSSVVSDTALRWSAANKSLGINMTTVPSGANLILKNSQEPVRTTVVATQTFGADTTNWTRGAGWTFNGTVAVATAATGILTYTPAFLNTSNVYEVTYTISNYTAGVLQVAVGTTTYNSPQFNGTYVYLFIINSASGGFKFNTYTFSGNLDNVSVVQIANPSPILFAGQDDGTATLYTPLRMPNSTTIAFGDGGAYTTGTSNVFLGAGAGANNTTGSSNSFFGGSAGSNNTTGINNNFFGVNAGQFNQSGQNNNFFGNEAGKGNLSGLNNNFFGFNAGLNNTSGFSNNFFGRLAGRNNTTGIYNNAFGEGAGQNLSSGYQNNFFGISAGQNTTSGFANDFIGSNSGVRNTVGFANVFIGGNAGYQITSGDYNTAIGPEAFGSLAIADTLTGNNNISIGRSAADNIRATATGNVGIGNQIDLPTATGNNQGVYQNVLFFTGASGTGTTIAAASKAGIKTNAPNRDFEVAGEVRITDLTTDAPTRLVGADADGDLGQVTLGAGLSLASSSLLADTSFLVTRFDTASMLTPYFKGDTTSLSNRINAKLNLSDTSNMLVPYLRKADTTSMLLPYFRDADTTSLNLNSRFATKLNISDTASMLAPYFRDADTTSLNLTSRFAAKLNLSDTASMLTNYLRTGTAASTYLTQSNAASTYLPLTGGTLSANRNNTLTVNSIAVNTSDNTALTVNATSPFYDNTNIGILGTGATVYSSGIGLKGEGTQKDMNGFGTAIGVRGDVNATFANSGGTNGTTYAGYFSNNATVDGNNYGLFVNTSNKGDYGIYQTGTGINYFGSNSTFAGNITANSFVKSLGTSLQFLKADGSVDANTYLTTTVAASTYLPLTGGTLTGTINRQDGSHDGSTSTFYYNILNYFARQDNIKINPTAQITFTDRPGTLTFPNNVRTSDIYLMTARNWNGTSLGQYLDTTLSIVANQDGGRIGISKLNPEYKLDVNGTFNASGNSLIGGTLGVTGATTLTGGINGNIKTNGAAGATATPDNIWLGNNWSNGTTSDKLKIYLYNGITDKYGFGVGGSGDIQYHSDFFHDFYIANTKKFFISNTNTTTDNIFTVNNAAVFNEGSTDSDFRVESDGNNNMVFVDASTDRVGIGTNSPTKTLDVNGELNVLSAGTFGGRLNTNWLERTYSNSTSTSLTVSVNTTWLKLVNNSTITLTLPNAATYPGKELHIKNAGTGAVNSLSSNIEPLNSTTIGTAILASGGGKWATLVSDGTYWVIMAGN